MNQQEKHPKGYIQLGNSEECYGQTEQVIISIKETFSPKCNDLTSRLKEVVKEFSEIGIEIDLSFRYNLEKVRELIDVKIT